MTYLWHFPGLRYNLINGEWSCQNNATLKTDLKERLGFAGWVMCVRTERKLKEKRKDPSRAFPPNKQSKINPASSRGANLKDLLVQFEQ